MQIKKLRALVKQGESEVLEFKKSTGQLQAAMQTICAFLNSDAGGTVLIGVADDGKIVGQDISDSTRKEIALELSKIEPHADVTIEYVALEKQRSIIVLLATEGNKAPYVYDGRPFIRSQSTTQKMSQEKYINLLHNRSSSLVAWDRLTTNNCVPKDLDTNRIKQVVDMAVSEKRLPREALRASIGEILKKFELTVGERLTNAAVILFCKKEAKQFMQSNIRLARFKGTTKSEFIDEKTIRGNAFDLFEQAMTFLSNYLPIGARIEEGNPFRVTTPAIPHKVLREAVVNALCHKDYSLQGGSLWIAVYDDRVEIDSSGRLPSSIKLDELTKKHGSHSRNKLIANVFYLCHMIEQWGRGTQEMVELCKQSGNPIPQFEESTGFFSVILPLKEPVAKIKEQNVSSSLTDLTNRQKDILEILRQGSNSREDILSKTSESLTLRTLQRELTVLKKFGLIASERKARQSVWFIVDKETRANF